MNPQPTPMSRRLIDGLIEEWKHDLCGYCRASVKTLRAELKRRGSTRTQAESAVIRMLADFATWLDHLDPKTLESGPRRRGPKRKNVEQPDDERVDPREHAHPIYLGAEEDGNDV